jgi:hypothetical protein
VKMEKMENIVKVNKEACGEDGAVGEDVESEGDGEGVKIKSRRRWRWRRWKNRKTRRS